MPDESKVFVPRSTRWPVYPDLRAHNLRDARLYADRADMIAALPVPTGGKVAEIGVWRGDFSKVLINTLKPREFFAFDIFTCHQVEDWNGLTGRQLFDGLTHRQYYEREMASHLDVTRIVEGDSRETLRSYTDGSFDLVYVDAAHDYDAVKADAQLAVEMTAKSGFLVFNDYMMFDLNNFTYGIVPVVNELAVNHGWDVVGFAINHCLYADIALQRTPPKPEPAPVEAEPAPAAAEPAPPTSHRDTATPGLVGRLRALAKMFGGR